MSDLTIDQISRFFFLYYAIDQELSATVIRAGMAFGGLCGSIWGATQGVRYGWRTLALVGAGLAAVWLGYRKHRMIARAAKLVAKRMLAGELSLMGHCPIEVALAGVPQQPPVDPDALDVIHVEASSGDAVREAAEALAAKHNRHPSAKCF